MDLSHVLWIGGGSGAGKSTLSRRLAYRHDLRLHPVDAYTFAHVERTDPATHPVMARTHAMDYQQSHIDPDAEQQAANFVDYAAERFAMIVDDIVARGSGPLVVVEGPQLFPHLVQPVMAGNRHGVWLLPSTEFTARSLGIRNSPTPLAQESDEERARRRRLERDALLTDRIRRDAAERALAGVEMDGGQDEDESERVLAELFRPLLDAGPRARDGEQRRAIRREENAVTDVQIAAFRASLGDKAPSESEFPYACECTNLGCDRQVPMTPSAYRAAGGADGH
ncbi:hypothetical protein GCM10011492_17580 [Flexivirga endophytica]|uniref:UDP-N-acetylglucosamine kinase n=1 Tax=Flexivirga endophytica TaxID=1849103 RepID=A0A916T2R6_9MICO|nr:hypothetical protein [Flexivirga endophytica]GGB27839.1 hypothetical protein GCM10011492_17580 [Flexivirga endophytica]GHB61668.1 hypothetical protein GCM10008112_33270 [Flexivirga endophytica]